jgi:hypothetical protein
MGRLEAKPKYSNIIFVFSKEKKLGHPTTLAQQNVRPFGTNSIEASLKS